MVKRDPALDNFKAVLGEDPRRWNVTGILLGMWLGYPRCCVMAWHAAPLGGRSIWGEEQFPLRGTGFIPCRSCGETKTADQLRAEIAGHRRCSTPFPDQPPTMDSLADHPDFKAWVKELLNKGNANGNAEQVQG